MNIQRSPDVNRKLEIEAGLASFIDELALNLALISRYLQIIACPG